ncbi:MAG: PstS family phosphate ABC transporter substrate-binding protein [Cyanobacteria bacterium P01_D01_bin.73]
MSKNLGRTDRRNALALGAIAVAMLGATACSRTDSREPTDTIRQSLVTADGSSTVFLITEAVAEEFQLENRDVRVTVGVSGSGGGFRQLCAGEIDISGSSRPIKASEQELCKTAGNEVIELPIAYDAVTFAINKENTWATEMTTAELTRLWEAKAEGTVTKWSDIRPEWPAEKISFFTTGTDSGTYEYVKAALLDDKEGRTDVTSSEDDNVLVLGISRDKYAIGFFGFAYYRENQDTLTAIAIDDGDNTNGKGAIAPSPDSVNDFTYAPFSRPIYINVNAQAAKTNPAVPRFIDYYLSNAAQLAEEVGYIALKQGDYQLGKERFDKLETGAIRLRQGL